MFSPEKYVCWQALQQGITLMPLENVQGGDMPGDTAHISTPVCRRVEKLLPHLVTKLEEKYGQTCHRCQRRFRLRQDQRCCRPEGGVGDGRVEGIRALRR